MRTQDQVDSDYVQVGELVKAFKAALIKIRGGKDVDLHVGSTEMTRVPSGYGLDGQPSLSTSVSAPQLERRGSDGMRCEQQNRNFGKGLTKSRSHEKRGLLGSHERWHVQKNYIHPTCQFCRDAVMAKVNNQPVELQAGQE